MELAIKKQLHWDFPLPRTHTGIVLGNGIQGVMVWGETTLNLTVARAGFWDHRGGTPFNARATYKEVHHLLDAGDEAGIRKIFSCAKIGGRETEPYQIGGSLIELSFASGLIPVSAELQLHNATLDVTLANKSGLTTTIRIRQAMDEELVWVEWNTNECGAVQIKLRSPWDFVRARLEPLGVQPPERWMDKDGGGFCQRLPEDAPLALAWHQMHGQLLVATALGEDCIDAVRRTVYGFKPGVAGRTANRWWAASGNDVPRIDRPDADLQHAWVHGLYKQAGLSTPGGLPASLQGPWMEEYQIPPWSNDYHFNINAEMIYWPALGTNRLAHFDPLWVMIKAWLPQLKEYGEKFFGVPGALLLPHAVDDRCNVIGSFWTGTIDQACTAWMAQMAWLHYRYGMDQDVLRNLAWPLLNGAFNGYWGMLEELDEDGCKRFSLPVSVSPEYNGAGMNAWGRDASFQLAALHAVVRILPEAARVLCQPVDPRWADVAERLPPYTLFESAAEQGRIALWRGMDLEESHRHHSHLGAIYPFATLDPLDPAHRPVVVRSLLHWNLKGAGLWTGWCIPWAAIICARCGLADAAVNWLRWWKMLYTNERHGSLHNSDFSGCAIFTDDSLNTEDFRKSPEFHEVMQIDAAMGTLTAVMELLVQCRHDGIYVLPRLPRHWRQLSFNGVRTEGAFLVGATVRGRSVVEVRVKSLAGQPLDLVHGIQGAWILNGVRQNGPRLVCATRTGEEFKIEAVS
ncbi:MAG: hypothetical protein WCL16_01250 [bacterium]